MKFIASQREIMTKYKINSRIKIIGAIPGSQSVVHLCEQLHQQSIPPRLCGIPKYSSEHLFKCFVLDSNRHCFQEQRSFDMPIEEEFLNSQKRKQFELERQNM